MDGHLLMNRRSRTLAVSGALACTALFATLVASGCGSTECSFTASCAGGTAIPEDGGGDAPVIIPADCDLKKSPKESPSCVDDSVGIFVDAKGKADASGTKTAPLPTITAAISKAISTQRSRVYICDGTYAEGIKMTSAVSIYGGFDCTWAHTGVKPKVAPTKGSAIEVRGVANDVIIQDIEATGASDATAKGSSAIGAFIVRSKVTLRSVTLGAGPGQEGAKGGSLSNYLAPASAGNKGIGTVGGIDITCTCSDGAKSIGGHGADGAGSGIKNGSSLPAIAAPLVNAGSSSAVTCGPGTAGGDGDADGVAEPVTSPGILVEAGWDVSKAGAASKNGRPGQGGGGGGAQTDSMFAGGGGGCGGCGGAGAAAGSNGGASIALVSFEATVFVDQAVLASGVGGRGGAGGDGQGGQSGGDGGTGICKGGVGGVGAGGSGGSGGAGGDSIAIAWAGATEPTVTATESKPGTGGTGGDGGDAGTGGGKPGMQGMPGKLGNSIALYRQQ